MKTLFFFLFWLLTFSLQAKEFDHCSHLQDEKKASITWYDFEGAIDESEEKKKLIFIDVYTNWCGWCKQMDKTTFLDPDVVAYMNEHFYAVKMDAESKDPIAFRETLYGYKMYNGKGYNELAVNLLGGKMSFPTFVVLSKRQVKIGAINGYQNKTQLLAALKKYAKK